MEQSGEMVCDAFIAQSNGSLYLSSLRGLVLSWARRVWLLSPALGFPGGSDGKEYTYNAGDLGSISGSGRSPREGNGNPLQCFCLGNPMDRGAWRATVHGVVKSQPRLRD